MLTNIYSPLSAGAVRHHSDLSSFDWKKKYMESLAAHDNLLKSIPKRLQMEKSQAVLQIVKDINRVQNFCRSSRIHDPVNKELEKVIERAGFQTFQVKAGDFYDPEFHESISQKDEEPDLVKSEVVICTVHAVGVKNSKTGSCVVPAVVSTVRRSKAH